jgi:hypothetical protein
MRATDQIILFRKLLQRTKVFYCDALWRKISKQRKDDNVYNVRYWKDRNVDMLEEVFIDTFKRDYGSTI